VCGINLAGTTAKRLLIGWAIALLGGVIGLLLSFHFDLPSGAAIVCTFGLLLVIVSVFAALTGRWEAVKQR
jgi:zinc/manganese transport system permease protein